MKNHAIDCISRICAIIFSIVMVLITIAINRRPKDKDDRRPAILKITICIADKIRHVIDHTWRIVRRHIPRTTDREISADEVPADIMREMLARKMCEAAKTAPHIKLDELVEDEQPEETVITVTV